MSAPFPQSIFPYDPPVGRSILGSGVVQTVSLGDGHYSHAVVRLGGTTDSDVLSLVTFPGYSAIPSWIRLVRTAGEGWGFTLADPPAGAPHAVIFIKAVRGAITDIERIIVSSVQTDGDPPNFVLQFGGPYTYFVTAGEPFYLRFLVGTEVGVSGVPATLAVSPDKPDWITTAALEFPEAFGHRTINFGGTAPQVVGTFAFDVTANTSSVSPLGDPVVPDTDRARFFFCVLPPEQLWTDANYTTSATRGSPFGWSFTAKVFAGSIVAIAAAPAWCSISGDTVAGTPPLDAGTFVTVTLAAVLGDSYQETALRINLASPEVDLWPGAPYAISAIEGQPVGWNSTGKIVSGAVFSIGAAPDWIAVFGSAISGTPPAGSGGTDVTVELIAVKAGVSATAILTISIAPPLAAEDLWIDAPYTATAIEGQGFGWYTEYRLAAGATATLGDDAPDWLVFGYPGAPGDPVPSSDLLHGDVPAGTGGTTVTVHLRAQQGSTIDTTTLTITIAPPPPPSMFQNAPYLLTITEGKPFNFAIALNDAAATVASGHLPPWLVFQPDILNFSGTASLGSGSTVIVVELTATHGSTEEHTTLTITVLPLASLGINLDLRNGAITFDAGAPIIKHKDSVILTVNCIPPDQGAGVTALKIRVKEADEIPGYGQLLYQPSSARLNTSTFQFAAITFANTRLDHALTLLDPIAVQQQVPFMFELEYGLNGLRRTSQLAPFTIERDFSLDTSAGGINATGGEGDDTGGDTGGGTAGLGTGSVYTFTLDLGGAVEDGRVFGYYVLPTGALITGLAVSVQAPDAAAGVTVALVDGTGTPYGDAYAVTAEANLDKASTDFGSSALALTAGAAVRAKIAYTPSSDPTAPAQNLTLHVTCRQ